MCLVGMIVISGFIWLMWMLASKIILMTSRVVGMAPMRFHATDVSMFLKVEDFTVYANVFWSLQVRGSYIIGQICSAEPKDCIVSREMGSRAVPHGEVHIIIGSFPSSRSYNSLYSVHSERDKITILFFVLVKGYISLFSVGLSILEEIQEHRAVFGVAQG